MGQTLAGTIATPGEVDLYSFTGTASDRVLITMAVSSGNLNPALELEDPQGRQICAAGSPYGSSAEITDCTLPASGSYTLRVHDYGDSDTGSYGLHLQRLNNPGGATALTFGQTVQATIAATAEEDTYVFTSTANDRVLITMAVSSGNLNPALELEDPQGRQICAAGSPYGSSAEITDCTLPASGSYTLRVHDYGDSDTGSYGLHLQRLNNPGGAMALTFGQTVQATIAAPAEEDTYVFISTANDRVLITMAVSSGNLNPALELEDPQGQQICAVGSPYGSSVEIADCTLPASGSYTLRVHDYGDSDTGSYGLHLQRLNNPGGATALTFGQTVQATIAAPAEEDTYVFTSTANDRVLITMAVSSGNLNPALELEDPQGRQICAAGSPYGSSVEISDCTLPVFGSYTLRVHDYGDSDTGSYSLHLDHQGPVGCQLSCSATEPTMGIAATALTFSAPTQPTTCSGPISFHWDFGDGATAETQTATHTYDKVGDFQWTLTVGGNGTTCHQSGTISISPPGTVLPQTVFFDGFDTYPAGSNLNGQGGWVNFYGGGITASSERAATPPQSCRLDNAGGCWESQLYHPLPYLDVLWFSADVLGVPTGRTGCHEYDVSIDLFNADQGGIWGSDDAGFALRSGPGENNDGPGLTVATSTQQVSGIYGAQELVNLEPDYSSLVNRWIHLQAKVDHVRHQMDVWVDGEYRGSLAMDPNAPPYKGIMLHTGEGLGFVDNVWVFTNGPEPGADAVELTLGLPLHASISGRRYRFFKVTSQPDRDLLVTLDQTGVPANLELYGSVGSPPSRSLYDSYDNGQTGAAHQSLVFPATPEPQTYYFLVYQEGGTPSVPFTLLAGDPGFHLDRVSPSAVSNSGTVTLFLIGSGFSPATRVTLIPPAGNSIAASSVQTPSSVRLYSSFHLSNAPAGLYDVRIDDPVGGSSTLAHGLQVTAGPQGALVAHLSAPANVRPDRNYTVTLTYANQGGTDLAAPLFLVSSPQDVLLRLSSAEPFRHGPLQVLGVNMNGPVGILTPGASFSIPIQFHSPISGSQVQLDLKVMKPDATPIDWANLTSEIRPPGIPDDAWAAVSANLKTLTGTTWTDYLATLTAASTYLAAHYRETPGTLEPHEVSPQGRLPVAVYSVRDLFSFELGKASASLSPRPVLAESVDAFSPAPGLPLTFVRLAPSPLAQRFRLGSLGRGWVNLYDTSLRVDADGSVVIREPWGQERVFFPKSGGAFSSTADEHATLVKTAQGYTLRETDGFVLSFGTVRLTSLEDTNGNRLTLVYTGSLLTSVVHSNGDKLVIDHTANGRISRVTDPSGRQTLYHYDSSGEHLTSVEEAGGRTTTYEYHPADGSSSAHALSTLTYPGGTHRYFTYDRLGRLSSESRDGGAERLTYAYDAQGTVTVTNATGGTLTLSLGHRGQSLDLQTSTGEQLSFSYDETGNPTHISNANGEGAALAYDGQGNPLGVRDAASSVTRLTYSGSLNRLASLLDPRGNSTAFAYDAHGNLGNITYPDGSREGFTVDAAGQLTSSTNRRGQTITYERNSRGQLVRKRYPNGSAVQYGYDGRGNLHAVTDSSGTIDLEYDGRDFLTRIAYPDGHSFTFEHDDSGRRTKRTDETGFSLSYEYDAAGRLERLQDTSNQLLIVYTYDAASRLSREDRGNSTATTYDYDSAGQVLHLVHYGPDGKVQSRFDYTYDALGNRTSMTTLEGKTTYDYDALEQLVGVTYPDGDTDTYEYDRSGNRITVTKRGVTEAYQTNTDNQYTLAGSTSLAYDADGNLVSHRNSLGMTTYDYDDENHIVRVLAPGGTWEYVYDALGNRVKVTHDGEITRFSYDPIGLVDVSAEYNFTGNLKARYIYGLGLVARADANNGAIYYYGFDYLGNTRQLTNKDGTVVNAYDYGPWGEATSISEKTPNPFLCVGRFGVMDEGNGTALMRERLYDYALGRFTSQDPYWVGGGDQNSYGYAYNQPIDVIDPSGGESAIMSWVTGGMVEGAAGGVITGVINGGIGLFYNKDNSRQSVGSALRYMGHSILHDVITGTPYGAIPGPINGVTYWKATTSRAIVIFEDISETTVAQIVKTSWARELVKTGWWTGIALGTLGNVLGDFIFPEELQEADIPTDEIANVKLGIVRPADPNEKTGPGPLVHPAERVTYTIYFENQKAATAAAQEVFITDKLDPNLDWSTLQLGEVAFGDAVVTSLAGHGQGSDRITFGNDIVQIEAGLSVSGNQVSWTLTTLDPNTDLPPDDPLAGFLPPEDGSGRGQGHVTFSIQVRPDAKSGAQVSNTADIVFDTNAALSTNVWSSTVQTPSADCSATALCLVNKRFQVDISWRDFTGHKGVGAPIALSDESGYFTFFDPTNAEVFIKVLDACALSGGFWVFDTHLSNVEYTITVTDRQTGQKRTVFNPLHQVAPSILGTHTIFTECGSGNGSGLPQSESIDTSKLPPNGQPSIEEVVSPSVVGPCVQDAQTICLNNGRFRVHGTFRDFQGNGGAAKEWLLTSDSGYSTFFADGNVELFFKVLDACALSGNYWVFASGLTNVAAELYIEDTKTGKVWHISNPSGRVFATALETKTFFTDCH